MKVFIAGLATETNSFSPMPTGHLAFQDTFVSRSATKEPANLFSAPMHVWRTLSEGRGWAVCEGLAAFAQPSGITMRATYESYRDEILSALAMAAPDIVLLSLHGAMIAEGYDDCEGDLITRARALVGPDIVIGVEIDPHSHLTPAMRDGADLIVAYKEYPHTDSADRARDLFDLAARTALGQIRPVMRDYNCRMVSMYHTTRAPMRAFVDQMLAEEKHGRALSLSLIHGFPWGDVAEVGTRVLAICDNSAEQAEELARSYGQMLWSLRAEIAPDWPDIDAALDKIEASHAGPLVLADFADNAGAGAPSDSTFVLQKILDRHMKDIALGLFWDPGAVRLCQDAGVGARLRLRVGGKVAPSSGQPVDMQVTVRAVLPDMSQRMGEGRMPMGTGVWIEQDGVHLVLCDTRTQAFHPEGFTDLGLDLGKLRAVVVKSSQHFYAGFGPIATEVVYINGPGTISPDYGQIPYSKRNNQFWPRMADPWAGSSPA
ncbi:MAG: M81 family metallopeptidase [Pseudoprimorskyibacter sp.]|nr:M81 family metallopeptidase [Pseudoprimorskyibacter sp.]